MIGGVGINPMLGNLAYSAQKGADDPKVQDSQAQLSNTAARPETSRNALQKPVQGKDKADDARLENPQPANQKGSHTDDTADGSSRGAALSIYA